MTPGAFALERRGYGSRLRLHTPRGVLVRHHVHQASDRGRQFPPRRALSLLLCTLLCTQLIGGGWSGVAFAQEVAATASDAARFLDQATFGSKPADIAHVQDPAFGVAGWLAEQFGMPVPVDYLDLYGCPTASGRCPD